MRTIVYRLNRRVNSNKVKASFRYDREFDGVLSEDAGTALQKS
jgi:hypothetical protein